MCTVYSFVYVSLYKISIKLRNSLILLHTLYIFIHTSSMTSTSHNELHFRRAWCYRLSTVPDSIVNNITVNYFRGSIFLLLWVLSLPLPIWINMDSAHVLYTQLMHCVRVKCQITRTYIRTVDLKGAFPGIKECSSL